MYPVKGDQLMDGGDLLVTGPARTDDLVDALDRSGLAMAGANLGPDGIVTAREIAGLDWWGTQLVVLSACETGVGAVASGDGVYGLRRALLLAGAASQVVSLWNVSDAATRELMRDYYDELVRGTGRAEALRSAKLRLLRQPRYAHPYYWAAFIPAGDWRPLDKNTLLHQGLRP
jgi:CHAT domain-containing protein